MRERATLRDQFAMAALSGMVLPTPETNGSWSKTNYEHAIAAAYAYAEKMMEYHRKDPEDGD